MESTLRFKHELQQIFILICSEISWGKFSQEKERKLIPKRFVLLVPLNGDSARYINGFNNSICGIL
jgi:hypothetical protein